MTQQMTRGALGLLAVVCAASIVTAHQVFRSAVEYVRLDVVVTDKNDRPVTGLTRDDFEVIEHGTRQTLSTFEAVSIPSVRREITNVKTTAPTIDVVSNAAPPLGRQWVLVIDDLHIIELHLRQTQQLVIEFLQQLPPEDQVAIVFVGRSDLSQGFTSDIGAAMRTVARIKDSLGFAYDAADVGGASPTVPNPSVKTRTLPTGDMADKMSSVIDANESDRHNYGQATIDVLNNVSRSLATSRYPRKNLVYVSEGMTYGLDGAFYENEWDFRREAEFARDFMSEMSKAFDIAKQAGVPVYTIDPRGAPDATATRSGELGLSTFRAITRQWNTMRTIAENTGGLAFVGNADLAKAVEQLVHDSDHFYLLGFYPEPLARDGKFHDVDVKIRNRPDLRVRARAGYTAPAATPPPVADLAAAFTAAMGAALPESGIALRAFAAPIAPGGRGMKTAVTLQVTYPTTAGKVSDTLDYAIVALDGDGKVKASTRKTFEFTASPRATGDATFVINDVVELPTQPLHLRIGVASHRLGKIGVIHTAIEPPRVSAADVVLGGVVLGYAGALREEAKPKGALADLLPFQPTTDRTFSTTDTLRLFAPVYWRGGNPATVTLSIRRGATVLVERRDMLEADAIESAVSTRAGAGVGSGNSRASFTTSLPLTGVPAGEYVMTISVSTSGQPAKREVAFFVR